MDPFTLAGTWWVPDREDDKLGGTLTYERGRTGLRLRLLGEFVSEGSSGTPLIRRYPIVLGQGVDGRKVTLYRATVVDPHAIHQATGSGEMEKFASHELSVHEAFLGAHLSDGRDTLVTAVGATFDLLDDWAWGDQPFARNVATDDSTIWRWDYVVPEALAFRAFSGTAHIIAGFADNSTTWHDHSVERPAGFQVEFDEPVPYDAVFDLAVKPFQYFLTVACSAPAKLRDVSVFTKEVGRQLGDVRVPTSIDTVRMTLDEPLSHRPHVWI